MELGKARSTEEIIKEIKATSASIKNIFFIIDMIHIPSCRLLQWCFL